MLTQLTVRDYCARLASGEPTPGGGSGAALVGALGAALGEMVSNFTVGKEKYRNAWERLEPVLAALTNLRGRLLDLTDQDATAYAQVGAAYAMPRETDAEKTARAEAIQDALKLAAQVPLGVCAAAAEAMELLPVLLEAGNPNLVSDVGVAAELLRAAFRCGWLNVEINLSSVKDEAYKLEVRAALQAQETSLTRTAAAVWEETVRRVIG
ncbi:MAG: cyclodeaminase/cyclohydrolase family protein [Armatimonadetes bacterium]|nr:cyclodeaminase/cyclohydrolase family protein [Armatimonadota bacterium]